MKCYKVEDIEKILNKLATEPDYQHPEEDWLDGVCIVETRIESLAPINIVRCSECVRAKSMKCPFYRAGYTYKPDDFCSDGERAEK